MRVLVTGLSTYWGGRLAQSLEQDEEVDTIIGIDRTPPKVALERTEFVQVADAHSLIQRIVHAAEIDTVIDTRLVVDSTVTTPRRAHENNVVGTTNILAACAGPDTPVRKLVFRSSAHYYGSEQDDPAFFTEEMERPHPPRTRIERDIVDAEHAVQDFDSSTSPVKVVIVRFAQGLGPGMRTAVTRLLRMPGVPSILGFDPRFQCIHEDDIVGILEHAARSDDMQGIYNGAADGVLALSEVAGLLGKPLLPILPPWGTGLAAQQLKRLGVAEIPPELLNMLRYGRGSDNRKLKATGYRMRYTSRETVLKFREALRMEGMLQTGQEPYRYEREVEEFLRYSPSIRNASRHEPARKNLAPGERADAVAALEAADDSA